MTHPEQGTSGFVALGLSNELVRELTKQGITEPTPIQAQAIPVLQEGHDLMASAQTGTGKTAAFLLPALNRLSRPATHHGKGPRILVLTPTRELAEQVSKVAISFARSLQRCKVVTVTGGVPYPIQHRELALPLEVLVATPGRLTDLMRSGRIDFRRLELLVLDEADRMLDMGFIDEVEAIVAQLPQQRQTALFSATLSDAVQRFAAPMLNNPLKVELAPQGLPTANVQQSVHWADGYEHKQKLTAALLQASPETQSIVFVATKADADSIADWLRLAGIRADAMHGDLQQRVRRKVLDRLRRSEIDVLVATDVAARGIDVAGIGQVINFDLPKFAEDYIHRIGRTGRAGRKGNAVSLVTKNDFGAYTKISRRYEVQFEQMELEGLEARFRPGQGRAAGDRGGKRPGGYGGNKPRHGQGGRWQGEGQSRAPRSEPTGRIYGDAPREHATAPRGEHRDGYAARSQDGYARKPYEGQRRDGEREFARPAREERYSGNSERPSYARDGKDGQRREPRSAGQRAPGSRYQQ
ncbi:DEAD/DEAH box helicase [Chitiniphilus purpureus]|uniref:DEAD/DEAH box helicase n=1 Tax=Chitiniphilus purpureus TaxID=2981137 RepID=A0ABY6DHG0_9NEIS|nr:DEAD/DEAH box helicase [Chitiniphilus sp. CD1]UXY13789.1 DEAD/DEAH box helicase [Chitiniphilus sp. CD1]